MLGLKNYLLQIFLFRRKPSTYHIRSIAHIPYIFPAQGSTSPLLIPHFTLSVAILGKTNHSVPVLRLIPVDTQPKVTIVYVHGNASDMGDSIKFISGLSRQIQDAEFVTFDYTGYGESRLKEVGEQVIADDIQMVLAWIKRPLGKTIIWGFSLGSYPATSLATRYPNLLGLIMQCPIASLSCMFYSSYDPLISFKDDHFSNLDLIPRLSTATKVLIVHSSGDQIIPIDQAKLLYDRYTQCHGDKNIQFIEVEKLGHNSLHRYIASDGINQLQKQVLGWVYKLMGTIKKTLLKTQIEEYSQQKLAVIRKNMIQEQIDEWEGQIEEKATNDPQENEDKVENQIERNKKRKRILLGGWNCMRS